MLAQALTIKRCKEIVRLLVEKRGWTIARIARTIGMPSDYVRRIQDGKQSFQLSDIEALARNCDQNPARLVFDSFDASRLSPKLRELHEIGQRELQSHEELQRVLKRKPAKKRRTPTRAA